MTGLPSDLRETHSAMDGKNSKYYKYLVDENEGTFELVDSFKVPYSGYVGAAHRILGITCL